MCMLTLISIIANNSVYIRDSEQTVRSSSSNEKTQAKATFLDFLNSNASSVSSADTLNTTPESKCDRHESTIDYAEWRTNLLQRIRNPYMLAHR